VVITDASPSITMVLPTRQVVASTARALASSMVTTLTVAWMVSPGLTGARRLLAEIHRARPGQTIRDGGGDHARGQEAMRNPPAEGCGLRELLVGVHGVVVPGHAGEEHDVGFRDRLRVGRMHAGAQVLCALICSRSAPLPLFTNS